MRLSSKTLSFLLNLLLGSAWALALIGALNALLHHAVNGWLYAIASAMIWALPGLLGVVILEYLFRSFERHEEMLKQTRLLEEILKEIRQRNER
jgi:uncharacterized membrane protein YuzA (DUF378 family)